MHPLLAMYMLICHDADDLSAYILTEEQAANHIGRFARIPIAQPEAADEA